MSVVQEQAEALSLMHYEHMREMVRLGSNLSVMGEDGVLMCLFLADKPLLSGDLVEKTGLTTGRIANILRTLETKGLIRRLQDAEDHRRVHVSLTTQGHEKAGQIQLEINASHERLIAYLGEEDADHLLHLFKRCMAYAEECLLQ